MQSLRFGSVLRISAPLLSLIAAPAVASAQEIAFSELAGSVVQANIHRSQITQREGRAIAVAMVQNWNLSINADNTIDIVVNTTVSGPKGTRQEKPNIATYILGVPRKIADRGGGEGIWQFDAGALAFIRTYPKGAYRLSYTFTRAKEGFACMIVEAFGREGGKGDIKLQPEAVGDVTILSSKLVSSTCEIVKKP